MENVSTENASMNVQGWIRMQVYGKHTCITVCGDCNEILTDCRKKLKKHNMAFGIKHAIVSLLIVQESPANAKHPLRGFIHHINGSNLNR